MGITKAAPGFTNVPAGRRKQNLRDTNRAKGNPYQINPLTNYVKIKSNKPSKKCILSLNNTCATTLGIRTHIHLNLSLTFSFNHIKSNGLSLAPNHLNSIGVQKRALEWTFFLLLIPLTLVIAQFHQ